MMLELDVVPERSLGCEQWEFILGMHFSQAVAIIQSQVGVIKGVQVYYSDTNPLDYDLILHLPQDGIRFVFDAVLQRLKLIEVFDMKLVKLKYCNTIFNSSEILPTIQEIEQCFGATHPGIFDCEKQMFTLNFRGLSFSFDVDSKFQPGIAQCGLGSLQFTTGVSPVVSKMVIYAGNNLKNCTSNDYQGIIPVPVVPLPISCYHGLSYVEKALVLRDRTNTKGIQLTLHMQGSGSLRRQRITLLKDLYFGITCQDVMSLLGSPSQVFYKSEDKMKIHSPNAHLHVKTPRRSDYFFNYFSLGLDILFDAKTQRMKKFILHTNYPGHYNFNMYNRCDFRICLNAEKQVPESKKQNSKDKVLEITAFTKWDDISDLLKHSDRPVVLNRSGCTNINPFGSTFCYGYQDMIFEVMQNQHIASVTFYKNVSDIADV
ncbi:PHAF1 protein CG7083 [Planococcus citri]|uniref:PHAF1 protein CG7083 n=1 Tax=Planococcus citri TaxID=170843 RepID=UPI0031F84390